MTTKEAINILYTEATNEERKYSLEEIEKAKEFLKKDTPADIESAMVTDFEQFKDVCTKFFQKHNPMMEEGRGLTFIVLYNVILGHNVFYCKFVRDEKEYSLKYNGISWDMIDNHRTLATALTLTGCFSKAFSEGEIIWSMKK